MKTPIGIIYATTTRHKRYIHKHLTNFVDRFNNLCNIGSQLKLLKLDTDLFIG